MSMCGEIENLEWEIKQTKMRLDDLEKRLDDLRRLTSPQIELDLDPDKRDWVYDGAGNKRPRNEYSD